MAGPWEKYKKQDAAPAAGPWDKFAAGEVNTAEPKDERGMISPVYRKEDGGYGLAVPQLAMDAWEAIQAPGKAFRGEYGVQEMPNGRITPITDEMMGDAAALATIAPMSGVGSMAAKTPSIAGKSPRVFKSAKSAVAKQLKRDGVPANQIGNRLNAVGPDAMIGDLGVGVQGMTQGVATKPGAGQKTVVDALMARQQGSNLRVQNDLNRTLGVSPTPSFVDDALKQSKSALSPEYSKAIANSKAVDTTDLAKNLDADVVTLRGKAQKSLSQVREMLNVNGKKELDTSPETLLQTRQAIDGLLSGETDGNVIRALSDARKQVDDILAASVPGIKAVDAKFADLARQGEGLKAGSKILDTGKTAPRPTEVAKAMSEGAIPNGELIGPSGEAFRMTQGGRAEIDRIVGNNLNDKTALRKILKGEGSWNRDRLSSVFGKDKADELLSVFEREARYAATEGPALAGSRTQVIKAAQDDLSAPQSQAGVIENTLNLKPGTAMAQTLDKLTGGAASRNQEAKNAMIGEILTSGQGDALTKALAARDGGLLEAAPLGVNLVSRALLERRGKRTAN